MPEKRSELPTLSGGWQQVISDMLKVPVEITYSTKRGTSYTYFDEAKRKFVITIEPRKEQEALCHLIHEVGHVALGFEAIKAFRGKYPGSILNLAEDIRINLDASSKYAGFREGANSYNAAAVAKASTPLQKRWTDIFVKSCNNGEEADEMQQKVFALAREMEMKKLADLPVNYETYLKLLMVYLQQATPEEAKEEQAEKEADEQKKQLIATLESIASELADLVARSPNSVVQNGRRDAAAHVRLLIAQVREQGVTQAARDRLDEIMDLYKKEIYDDSA